MGLGALTSRFSSPPQIRAIIRDMEAYLRAMPDFAEAPPRQVCRVVLGDVGSDALPINVTAFIASPGVNQAAFERRKSDILCDLADVVTRIHGVPLALPSSSIAVAGYTAFTTAPQQPPTEPEVAWSGGMAVPKYLDAPLS